MSGATQQVREPDEVLFARDVQPLLAKHCFECHGPDEAEGGLRLDTAESATAALKSGRTAVAPGRPDISELLRRVSSTDDAERMPPEGPPLSPQNIERLRRWITAGAEFEAHWAYQAAVPPANLPQVKNSGWVRNAIDRFVLARLEQSGVSPSAPAGRATLIRRLSYDLIGLPPSPADVDAFVTDPSPDAYAALVDRLLASKHFGERWGRHWLDKARYADSDGYEKDRPRPNAWRYRDWVINAINADMPFDQFTVEQLAGDLLPRAAPLQKLATAFHRQTLTNTEGGTDQEQFRVEATFDRTETTSAVWMGLTMTCARCHTHKYDRITQHEYYRLFSFFDDANEATVDVVRSRKEADEYQQALGRHTVQLAGLTARYAAARAQLQPEIDAWAQQMTEALASRVPVAFSPLRNPTAKVSGKSKVTRVPDGSFLLAGPAPDKDLVTISFAAPEAPLTGLRLEVLPDRTLPATGPGRAPNGNFVLSELRAFAIDSDNKSRRLDFSVAESTYNQPQFPAGGVLSTKPRSGWAIGPRMGKPHTLTLFLKSPVSVEAGRRFRVELDQQYGGQHTLGRFRLTAMSGYDPTRALPKSVAAAIRKVAGDRSTQEQTAIADHVATLHPATARLVQQIAQLRQQAPRSPVMSVRVIVPAKRETRLLHRGDFLQPADPVVADAPGVVTAVHPLKSRRGDQPPDRLDFARWLVHENHPLTARVTVNQVWAHLFGRGLVPTQNDFGVRGDLPTHPKLLDWLAFQFPRDMHWSRKELIRTIVMSATYRQSSRHRRDLQAADPTNRLLARQNRIRVEAEVIRDLSLAVSGLLSPKVGGPSVFPPLPPGVAELSYANNFKWKTSDGEDRYRRGMYTFFKRTSPHPTLINFDCPDSNTTRLQREVSNTPLQALATLNNDVFTESAQAMASRVLQRPGDDTERLNYALRLCLARKPAATEVRRFAQLLNDARSWYAAHTEDARLMTARHAAEGVPAPENAAWVATLRMVLNLDDFIVRD